MIRRLRVVQVAPPWYPIPPGGYGGIERVIHLLAGGLRRLGHEVVVLGRSGVGAEGVVDLAEEDWSKDLGGVDQAPRLQTYLHRVHAWLRDREVDVVHDHNSVQGVGLAVEAGFCPLLVATAHGPLTPAEMDFYREIGDQAHLVAISEAQRKQAPEVRWLGVAHNAVDVEELDLPDHKEDYLVQLARISPDKGQHVAIEIAKRVGHELVLAGKVAEDSKSRRYFRREIEPHLGSGVTWIEDVAGAEKARLLAQARAMVFPIQWEEPFGIAVVEAMASGTPVLATPRGAMPELIEAGVTGWLGETVDDLVERFAEVEQIDPMACARSARDRFSPERMAASYERAYLSVLGNARTGQPEPVGASSKAGAADVPAALEPAAGSA